MLQINELNLSTLANLCTIFGFFIALITLLYFFKEKKENLEYKTREIFLKKMDWTNEGDIHPKDSIFFKLTIENPTSYIFSGNIEITDYHEKLTFYFEKIYCKTIYLKIHKNIGYRDYDLGRAKLRLKSSDLFQITFIKGFEEDNHQPEFPYKTYIW